LNILLDTHALMWWVWDNERLSQTARHAIRNAETVFVSSVSAIEIAIKYRIGKLPNGQVLAEHFVQVMQNEAFAELPVSWREASLAGRMAGEHRDPFDRLLIAQGLINNLTLVSNEQVFDSFGVARLW
jgi:PIN domain nuclease of toxin-antitoxin system